jgi:hypothetical protein
MFFTYPAPRSVERGESGRGRHPGGGMDRRLPCQGPRGTSAQPRRVGIGPSIVSRSPSDQRARNVRRSVWGRLVHLLDYGAKPGRIRGGEIGAYLSGAPAVGTW